MKKIIFSLFLLIITNYSMVKSIQNNLPDAKQSVKESANPGDQIKIGLYGIGLDTYWSQFEGLYEKLTGYQQAIADRMSAADRQIEVINTGIVDNPQKAREVGAFLAEQNVDAIFLNISTYALSSTVLPVVQDANAPVIVLSIQPTKAMDYEYINSLGDRGLMTGEWLAYVQACSAPEIANVFNRAKIDYHLITGSLDDESTWKEVEEWLDAIKVASFLRDTRMGLLGHYYGGMLDVYSDITQFAAVFGCHFEILEMSTLYNYTLEATDEQIRKKIEQFYHDFDVDPGCDEQDMSRAARTSVALETMVNNKQLGGMAYYYEGSDDSRYEDIITSVIPGNTLLTMHNIPVAGEYEVKNALAMKIMDLMGIGGSFSEFIALDLKEDIVLLGHDGPGHARIAEGKVKLVPLPVYHGKPGKGLSIQMSVQHGPVTVLSVVQTGDGKIKFLVAEGESVPGQILNIGNTGSRYHFSIGAKRFLKEWSEQGPSHHMAIGIGHAAGTLEKLAKILGVGYIRIC